MADQNVWTLLTDDPVEAAQLNLKSKLFMVIICHHRDKLWSKKKLRNKLGASKVQVKALLQGSVGELTTDDLFGWLVKLGYAVHPSFDKSDAKEPLIITVAKAKA